MKFYLLSKTSSRGLQYIQFCTPYNPMHDPLVHEHIIYRAYRSNGGEWEVSLLCYDVSFEYRPQPIALTNEVKDWLDSQ